MLTSDLLIEVIDLYTETPDIIILPPSAHHEIISMVNNPLDMHIAASLASLAAMITVCCNVHCITLLPILSCSPTQPYIGPTFNMMLFKMSPLCSLSLFGWNIYLFFADTSIIHSLTLAFLILQFMDIYICQVDYQHFQLGLFFFPWFFLIFWLYFH